MSVCVHAIPGRARFVVSALRGSPTVAGSLSRRLRAVDGVRRVEVRPRSASLVVHYDAAVLSLAALCAHMTAPAVAAGSVAVRSRLSGLACHWGTVVGKAALTTLLSDALAGGARLLLRRGGLTV